MPVIGITGGIATGKSSFAGRLARCLTAEVFDADSVARSLLSDDEGVKRAVMEAFGPEIGATVESELVVDRSRLREIVFRDFDQLKKLEAVLHPPIRERWADRAKSFRCHGSWLLVDLPLLFETGAEIAVDTVVVVACAEATQRNRVVAGRALSGEMAGRIIAAQQSLSSKVARAQHVIWSDGPLACLDEQARIFAGYLQERYG